MAKNVYESKTINLIDGTEILMSPLKIKFLKEFMDIFDLIKFATNDEQSIMILSECATICMKQHYPVIENREQLEDLVDLPTIYEMLDICAGIKINGEKEDIEKQAKDESDKSTWNNLDLASLEAEIFIIGSWQNFDHLERSVSMSELLIIIEKIRDLDYNEKKFLAAMQGVDLDEQSGKSNKWEEMKARVFSGGATSNPNDITALQGINAQKAGFGIGMGLGYEKIERKKD
jgi:hypothetical protein